MYSLEFPAEAADISQPAVEHYFLYAKETVLEQLLSPLHPETLEPLHRRPPSFFPEQLPQPVLRKVYTSGQSLGGKWSVQT